MYRQKHSNLISSPYPSHFSNFIRMMMTKMMTTTMKTMTMMIMKSIKPSTIMILQYSPTIITLKHISPPHLLHPPKTTVLPSIQILPKPSVPVLPPNHHHNRGVPFMLDQPPLVPLPIPRILLHQKRFLRGEVLCIVMG